MKKVLKHNIEGGSGKKNEPRRVGQIIIDDILFSNEHPLCIGFRQCKLFEDIFPNTEPCCQLKLLTRQPGRLKEGSILDGIIARCGDEQYIFVENPSGKKVQTSRRNPIVYSGKRINVHKTDGGMLYPTFNRPRYTKRFTFSDFCREAAKELLAVAGLVKK